MADWNGYRYFLSLSRHGTLKAAAKKLGVNQTTVGRQIAALESELGAQLFEKKSSGYLLTAKGQDILKMVENAEDTFLSLERFISGTDKRIEGNVRIAMPGGLANHWFIPRLQGFFNKHPKLKLEFLTGPEVLNLSNREADLALRLVKPDQKELLVRKLGHMELKLYGHSAIFEPAGVPTSRKMIANYPFIGLYPDATSAIERTLLKQVDNYLHYAVRSAAWSSVYYAVHARLGIGVLPTFMVPEGSSLVPIEFLRSERAPIWLAIHPDIAQSARVRTVVAWIDNLAAEL